MSLSVGIYSMRGLFSDRSSSRSMASSALRFGVPVSSVVEAGACTRGSRRAPAADVVAEAPPLPDAACSEGSVGAPAADVAAEAPPLSDRACTGGAPAVDVDVEVDSSIFPAGAPAPLLAFAASLRGGAIIAGGAVAPPLLAFAASSRVGAIFAGGAVAPLFAVPALSTGGARLDVGAAAPLFAVPALSRGGTVFDLTAMAGLFPVKRTSVTDKVGSGCVSSNNMIPYL